MHCHKSCTQECTFTLSTRSDSLTLLSSSIFNFLLKEGSDLVRLVFAHPFPLNNRAPIASANVASDGKTPSLALKMEHAKAIRALLLKGKGGHTPFVIWSDSSQWISLHVDGYLQLFKFGQTLEGILVNVVDVILIQISEKKRMNVSIKWKSTYRIIPNKSAGALTSSNLIIQGWIWGSELSNGGFRLKIGKFLREL